MDAGCAGNRSAQPATLFDENLGPAGLKEFGDAIA